MKRKGPFTAVVTGTDDPLELGRVQLRQPEALDGPPLWARVLVPQAGPQAGVWFRPDVGDEVVVDFLDGDRQQPIVLGALWNAGNPPPPAAPEEHVIRTRGGHTVSLNDGTNSSQVAVTSASGRRLLFDDSTQQGRIELSNAAGTLRIVIDDTSGTITVEAASGDIIFSTGGDLTLSAANINLDAAAQVNITGGSGVDVDTNAVAQIRSAVTQLASSTIQIDGALVLVNGQPLS